MTQAVRELYQRTILEHNAHPHNRGPLPERTHEATVHNPLCGDQVTVRFVIAEGRIQRACFEGEGCAVSRASASLLTLKVADCAPREALSIADELDKLVTARGGSKDGEVDAPDTDKLGDLVALSGVRDVPARRRCATLPWEALRRALANASKDD